jgi:(p)ppGpp synthase/HD superfamily hydrolase
MGSRPELTFARHLPLTREAIEFADDRHSGQRREADSADFMLHPLEVATLLDRSDYPDHVVAAAVLHDVMEHAHVPRAELEERFGPEVSDLVAIVSDDPSIADEEERKSDLRQRVRQAGGDAAAIYAADKISKVRELRLLGATGRAGHDAQVAQRRHRDSLAMLEETMPENRLVELLRFELEALEEFPPAASRPASAE